MTANPTRTLSTERRQRLGLLTEPLGYVDGQNLYEYVKSDPVGGLDPSGLWLFMPSIAPFMGSPVHETMTLIAAERVGYTDENKDFRDGLREGSIWPDVPDGQATSLAYLVDVDKFGHDKLQDAIKHNTRLTYRSHFHDLQYWHGMAVPGKTCEEMVSLIADWIVGQYQKALDAKDRKTRGIELGKALHTLQDTYAPSHTIRQWREVNGINIPMEIKRFQDYSAQDTKKHRSADSFDPDNPMSKAAGHEAIFQSSELLKRYANGASAKEVRKWLTEGDMAPLNLSKLCECGGTDRKYGK